MGRAFLSTAYLPPAPPPPPAKLQRWSPENRFDPDDEHLGGLEMVYEAVVDPLASAAPATVASIDAVAAAAGAERDDASSTDGDSDTATALSSPASATSNEAAQLASLQRRLTAAAARPPNTAGPAAPPPPATAPAAQTDTARRIQEHVAAISSLFAPPSATPGRSPRRAATLSSLDILTRPAVAQSI